jgi:hypothetical protein
VAKSAEKYKKNPVVETKKILSIKTIKSDAITFIFWQAPIIFPFRLGKIGLQKKKSFWIAYIVVVVRQNVASIDVVPSNVKPDFGALSINKKTLQVIFGGS